MTITMFSVLHSTVRLNSVRSTSCFILEIRVTTAGQEQKSELPPKSLSWENSTENLRLSLKTLVNLVSPIPSYFLEVPLKATKNLGIPTQFCYQKCCVTTTEK